MYFDLDTIFLKLYMMIVMASYRSFPKNVFRQTFPVCINYQHIYVTRHPHIRMGIHQRIALSFQNAARKAILFHFIYNMNRTCIQKLVLLLNLLVYGKPLQQKLSLGPNPNSPQSFTSTKSNTNERLYLQKRKQPVPIHCRNRFRNRLLLIHTKLKKIIESFHCIVISIILCTFAAKSKENPT